MTLKAYKEQEKPAGFLEYLAALLRYKNACKEFKRVSKFKGSENPAQRLIFFDAQSKFSNECKEYNIARQHYSQELLLSKLKDRGATMTPDQMINALGLNIPTSMKDMIEEGRRQAIASTMTTEQIAAITKAALEYKSIKPTIKESFLKDSGKEDFTNDMSDTF